MNTEVCPFCGAQRAATIFAVIWKCGSSTLVGSQGADAPSLRQGTMCRRLCEQQDKIDRLTALLAPFASVAKGIPENWPAHCPLCVESGLDTDGVSYEWLAFHPPNVEGRNDLILPTIGQWRAAAEAAEGVSDGH